MKRSACFLLVLLLTAQPASSRWDRVAETKQQLRADGARAGAAAVETTGDRFGITDASAATDASNAGAHAGAPGHQVFKATVADGASDLLGAGLDISSDEALVVAGAWGDDDMGANAGAVYFLDGTLGTILRKVTATSVAGDQFGRQVAISSDGTRVVVGAPGYDGSAVDSGKVYILDGTTGATLFEVTAEAADEEEADQFGTRVAMSSDGTRIVVGVQMDSERGHGAGAVYFLDGTGGTILRKVTAPDGGASRDYYGVSVAISSDGTRVVVGASGHDDKGSASGSVYVLDWPSGTMLRKVMADDGAAGDEFGASVAISSDGTHIAVGAPGGADRGSDSGSVYYGAWDATLSKLTALDGAADDWFGGFVKISSDGARVVVGASGEDDRGSMSGSVYVFDWTTGDQLLKVNSADQAPNDRLGLQFAINSDGTRIVAGTKDSVYMFEGAAAAPASATGDPHLMNIHGERFDLMKPGNAILIQIPLGHPVNDTLLTIEAEARQLGEQCADLYFQKLSVTGAWAEKLQPGGVVLHAEGGGHERLQTWTNVGPLELKVAHGKTINGLAYLNFYVKHLGSAGAAVGGLLGEDDHADAAEPLEGCRKKTSLAKKTISISEVGHASVAMASEA